MQNRFAKLLAALILLSSLHLPAFFCWAQAASATEAGTVTGDERRAKALLHPAGAHSTEQVGKAKVLLHPAGANGTEQVGRAKAPGHPVAADRKTASRRDLGKEIGGILDQPPLDH